MSYTMRQLWKGQKKVPHIVAVPTYIIRNGTFLYATTNMDHILVTPFFMFITFIPHPLPGILTAILNTNSKPSSVHYTFTHHGSYHLRAVIKSQQYGASN
jgi:hypothetical protein